MAAVSKKSQQSDETREAILASCLALFARHGFASTSMDEIARDAGLTKGAIYWHFENKEALFAAILERIGTSFQAAVLGPVRAESDPTRQLRCLFDGYEKLLCDTPQMCLFLQRVLLEDDGHFSSQVARVFEHTAARIARIIEQGKAERQFQQNLDSRVVAHAIIGALAGVHQQSLTRKTLRLRVLIEETKRATLARILLQK